MASGPIFEWTPGNFIVDPDEDEAALDEVMQNVVYDEEHIQGEEVTAVARAPVIVLINKTFGQTLNQKTNATVGVCTQTSLG